MTKKAKSRKAPPGHSGKLPRDLLERNRIRGADEELYFGVGKCSLGKVLVASSDRGVVCIVPGVDADQLVHDLQERFPKAHLTRGDRDSADQVARVIDFIEAPARGLDLPLDMRGTAFQRRVWRAVREIPAGRTSTYTEIARRIGAPKAVRAVGNACSTNNLSFAIPCHRVLRKDGSFSEGIHWGAGGQGALINREIVSAPSPSPVTSRRKNPRR